MNKNITVSLTSYGQRIHTVHVAIQAIFNQSKKVQKVLLWLAQDEFTPENIPITLKTLQEQGLQIYFCEDIKSYKKLIPTLKMFPDDIIITFDDDIYYKQDVIEKLYNSYLSEPDVIHCIRGHQMKFLPSGTLDSYNNWDMCIQASQASLDIFPTGAGGVLYPPNVFHEDILRSELFMSLAPYGDDIWFKAMSLLQKTQCKVVAHNDPGYSKNLECIENTQQNALWLKNKNEDEGNNKQIKEVFGKYFLFARDKEIVYE